MSFVFHYTFGHKLPLIAASGCLVPTAVNIAPRERAVLWWSRHATFEPTAAKARLQDGVPVLLTFDEMVEHLGVYRFGLSASDKRLVPWQRLQRVARIPVPTVAHMVRVGLERGAKPHNWHGTFDPVPLAGLVLEGWRDGAWVPMAMDEAIAASPSQQRDISSGIAPGVVA